ncbi:(d)CMP kinase [Fodinicurvata sp. EGI_FJ10296]|uniref:(d)CMP kinase n=1 Tax=Fodinicurvata sp. EGI_FJ10296 TaxID=3231908 RepID=UPI0034544124
MIIAIDGPAASGKGTLARRLAARYGLRHLDTGALYRACGLAILRAGGDPDDAGTAVDAARTLDPALLKDPAVRRDDVGQAASKIAARNEVRQALLQYQRDFAAQPPGAVLDGRDIGTVVCPDALLKLFVTASLDARAQRRFKELRESDPHVIYDAVLNDMRERDERDSKRSVAPLVAADDAFVIDTSNRDADDVFHQVVDLVSSRMR